jgi:hypothetical protein
MADPCYNYLYHHGLHWEGRKLLQMEINKGADSKRSGLFFLGKCKEFGKCEFDLMEKTKKILKENKK